MEGREHLSISGRAEALPYTHPGGGGDTPKLPMRDRQRHADRLRGELDAATAAQPESDGHTLEIAGEPDFELAVESLDLRGSGICLNSVREVNGVQYASIFVPAGKVKLLIRRIEAYRDQDTEKGQPKNAPLVASISHIRAAALRSLWTDPDDQYPADERATLWWEVWLRVPSADGAQAVRERFVDLAATVGLEVGPRHLVFGERLVVLAWGSPSQWAASLDLINMLAEVRRARELVTPYLDLSPADQRLFVDDAVSRIAPPPGDAPAVCLLDRGVDAYHPLLAPAIAPEDCQAVDPAWPQADTHGHGTMMAGIALYGTDLADFLASPEALELRHRLESVKLLPDRGSNKPELHGSLTIEALARAEVAHPRRQRVACLAVTNDPAEGGRPSSWSAAVDEHSAGRHDGQRRLYVVAAGNVEPLTLVHYEYPGSNLDAPVQDPAQAWNALTVGSYTDRVDPGELHYQPVARAGGLGPSSRTSLPWGRDDWPYKPDLCAEGGNYALDDEGRIADLEDLASLTTTPSGAGHPLGWIADTSAATAEVARLAAELQARYPSQWPETTRALLVHSAHWTAEMKRQMPGARKGDVARRLRAFGYGVPDLDRAVWSQENQVCLVFEGEFQPFYKDGAKRVKTRDNHLHRLPWPVAALQTLADTMVTVRVTLSYFVEPSPGNCGWGLKHRYQSHGLRFKMRQPGETVEAFAKRVAMVAEGEERAGAGEKGDSVDWVIGEHLRVRGSLHCDWWRATAAQVADAGLLAVYPVHGWWSKRPHLECHDRKARYSLVVSLETEAASAELYTAIEQILTRVPTTISR